MASEDRPDPGIMKGASADVHGNDRRTSAGAREIRNSVLNKRRLRGWTHTQSGDSEWRWRVRCPVRKEVRAGRSHFGSRWCFNGVVGPDHMGSECRHRRDAGGLSPEHSSILHA